MTQVGPKGSRPEALAKFAEVARHDDGQPVREGVLHRNQGAKKAIKKLPDRTAKNGKRLSGSRSH